MEVDNLAWDEYAEDDDVDAESWNDGGAPDELDALRAWRPKGKTKGKGKGKDKQLPVVPSGAVPEGKGSKWKRWRSQNKKPSTTSMPQQSQKTSAPTSDPTQLQRAKGAGSASGNFTGSCFRCGLTGHRAQDC